MNSDRRRSAQSGRQITGCFTRPSLLVSITAMVGGTGWVCNFSDDGIHWTPYENNPMFDVGPTGSWDSLVVGDHGWIKDGDRFKLWFTGISHPEYGYTNQFGYAESFDGIHWKKCMYNPVLKQGKPGDWDGGWMSCAAVIKLGDKDDELATGVLRWWKRQLSLVLHWLANQLRIG